VYLGIVASIIVVFFALASSFGIALLAEPISFQPFLVLFNRTWRQLNKPDLKSVVKGI
jgi:hypothetical protein